MKINPFKIKILFLALVTTFSIENAWTQESCQMIFYTDDMASVKMIPDDFIETFGQLSKTQAQHDKKWKHYYSTPIYRGDVSRGELNLDTVISYFIKVKESTTGNGVTQSTSGVKSAFKKYNQRFNDMESFFEYLKSHHAANDNMYWETLMTSWSNRESMSDTYFEATNLDNYPTKPSSGYGVKVMAFQPKTGLDAERIQKEGHDFQYGYSGENEVSIVGAMDPEFIQEGIFLKFKRETYGFNNTDNARFFHAKRIGFNKLKIIDGRTKYAGQKFTLGSDSKSLVDVLATYEVHIKPDGTYKVYQLN